jgi:hypothetical protein
MPEKMKIFFLYCRYAEPFGILTSFFLTGILTFTVLPQTPVNVLQKFEQLRLGFQHLFSFVIDSLQQHVHCHVHIIAFMLLDE